MGGVSLAQGTTTDELTFRSLGGELNTSTTKYADFSGVKLTSAAVYVGNFAKTNKTEYIQIRSRNNSGIVTTTSAGTVKSVTFTFDASNNNKVDVYGKNEAYASAADLYSSATQGTKIGTATTSSVTVTPEESYQYIGIRSAGGAVYITSIKIEWETSGSTKTSTTVSFGENYDGKTINLKPGDEFTAPTATLTPAEAGTLTYSSSDEKVATVGATGAVTLTGTTGKTTITAAFAGNDTYAASSASYTLNVAEALSLTGDGTKANPYTVADVLAIVNAGQQTTDSVYVKGIVGKIKTTADNIVKYKNCDYYLVDNEGDTDSIMAFRGKYLGNTDFTSADQLKVGDKVLVLGVLTKYKDIIELDKDNYIVEFLNQGTVKTATTVTFRDGNDKIYYEKVGGTFNYPTATLDPEGAGELTYTSSNPDVATVNAQTGEVTLSDKNSGSTIITAAFAGSDKYEASKASYTIVVSDPSVQTKTATFDFTLPGNYNKGTSDSDGSTDGDMAEGESIRQDDVTLTVTTNGSPSTRFWKSTDKIDFRIYNGAKLTLSVPDGYIISSVVTDPTDPQQTIGDVNQQNVELTYTGTVKLNNMTVVYAKVPETGVTVDMDEYGYVTLYYSDRALEVPEGAKALTYKVDNEGLKVSREYAAGKVIPADEAVVVSAAEGKYIFKYADGLLMTKDPDNMLLGTDETKLIEGDASKYYFYKLSLDDNYENIGFYWGDADGGLFANQAHKAYLVVPKSQAKGVKSFSFGGNGETTGIDAIGYEKANVNAPVYNLAGQRVTNSYKGIVIRNGKKFVK